MPRIDRATSAIPTARPPHRVRSWPRRASPCRACWLQPRSAPDQLLLAGFSQGAMLALDVALTASPAPSRVALLSGALLVEAAARFEAPRETRPALFISHGRQDRRLPFSGAEGMKAALEAHGFPVTWRPFEGGHEIPEPIVAELQSFLFGA